MEGAIFMCWFLSDISVKDVLIITGLEFKQFNPSPIEPVISQFSNVGWEVFSQNTLIVAAFSILQNFKLETAPL